VSSDDELLLKPGDVPVEEDIAHTAFHHALSGHSMGLATVQDLMEEAFKASATATEPKSLAAARKLPPEEWDKWWKAANEEINSLIENGTFQLVKLPPNRSAIGSRWVFKVKRNADGSIECYKGRLVAKGYSQ
jgi:fructose-1,6-bisphosphatase